MVQDLNAVLSLTDKIPDSMLRLGPEQYAEFLWAQSGLRSMVRLLEAGRVSAGGGVNWPMIHNCNALSMLRKLLSDCPEEIISETIATLAFLKETELIQNVQLDISSAEASFNGGEWKSATVMAGAALEALLLWAVAQFPETERASIIKLLNLGKLDAAHPESSEWGLAKYISVAEQLKAITASTAQQARLAQDFRNLIHPGRQVRLQMKCDRGTARSRKRAGEKMAEISHLLRRVLAIMVHTFLILAFNTLPAIGSWAGPVKVDARSHATNIEPRA
jgi:hypothetical protein